MSSVVICKGGYKKNKITAEWSHPTIMVLRNELHKYMKQKTFTTFRKRIF